MSLGLFTMSLGLSWLCGIRAYDGLVNHDDLGGSSPLGLVISLSLIWAAKTLFEWGATMDREAPSWWLYVTIMLVWTTGLGILLFSR